VGTETSHDASPRSPDAFERIKAGAEGAPRPNLPSLRWCTFTRRSQRGTGNGVPHCLQLSAAQKSSVANRRWACGSLGSSSETYYITVCRAVDGHRLAMKTAVLKRRPKSAFDLTIRLVCDFHQRAILISPSAEPPHGKPPTRSLR
jgi:hypothetical protein